MESREQAKREASKKAYEERNYEARREANRLSKARQRAKRKAESGEVQAVAAQKNKQYQARYRERHREALRYKEDARRSWKFCMEKDYMAYIGGELQRRNGHLKYPEDYRIPLDVTSNGRPYRNRKANISTKWVQACVNARRQEQCERDLE